MNILILSPDSANAVFYHRLYLPFSRFDNVRFTYKRVYKEDLEWADILIVSRLVDNRAIDVYELCKKYNVKFYVDFDDWCELPDNHTLQSLYRKVNMKGLQTDLAKWADGVIVTNEQLKKLFYPYNKNIIVAANAFPFGELQFSDKKQPSERMRFFYAGGQTHKPDIELLREPAKQIRKDELFKKNGQFVLAGYNNADQYYWNWCEECYSGGRPNWDTFKRLDGMGINEYMSLYEHCDVGLVPLVDNLFNRCKSNLKLLELGTKNCAAIVTKISTYTVGNPPVKWVEKKEDWYKWVRYYLENPNAVIDDGMKLGEWVRAHHHIDKVNEVRRKITDGSFEKIIFGN